MQNPALGFCPREWFKSPGLKNRKVGEGFFHGAFPWTEPDEGTSWCKVESLPGNGKTTGS
jgi:Leu/Phe-tRNA-protein transferase